jgi:hypothetical protein
VASHGTFGTGFENRFVAFGWDLFKNSLHRSCFEFHGAETPRIYGYLIDTPYSTSISVLVQSLKNAGMFGRSSHCQISRNPYLCSSLGTLSINIVHLTGDEIVHAAGHRASQLLVKDRDLITRVTKHLTLNNRLDQVGQIKII